MSENPTPVDVTVFSVDELYALLAALSEQIKPSSDYCNGTDGTVDERFARFVHEWMPLHCQMSAIEHRLQQLGANQPPSEPGAVPSRIVDMERRQPLFPELIEQQELIINIRVLSGDLKLPVPGYPELNALDLPTLKGRRADLIAQVAAKK